MEAKTPSEKLSVQIIWDRMSAEDRIQYRRASWPNRLRAFHARLSSEERETLTSGEAFALLAGLEDLVG